MGALPDAVVQSPACGACHGETYFEGNCHVCVDCRLRFDLEDLSASFLDDEDEPCGAPCDNSWHGDGKIREGIGYDCGACKLPADHESMHWTGCQSKTLRLT